MYIKKDFSEVIVYNLIVKWCNYPCQLLCSLSLSVSVSYNLVPVLVLGFMHLYKILIIHVLLIHVSEIYNTIMSLHALGISVDVHISQLC